MIIIHDGFETSMKPMQYRRTHEGFSAMFSGVTLVR